MVEIPSHIETMLRDQGFSTEDIEKSIALLRTQGFSTADILDSMELTYNEYTDGNILFEGIPICQANFGLEHLAKATHSASSASTPSSVSGGPFVTQPNKSTLLLKMFVLLVVVGLIVLVALAAR